MRHRRLPDLIFSGLGYEACALGTRSLERVAILEPGWPDRHPRQPDRPARMGGKLEPRAIAATCGGVRVWSLLHPQRSHSGT